MGSISTPHHLYVRAALPSPISRTTSTTATHGHGGFYFHAISLPFWPNKFPHVSKYSLILRAGKKTQPSLEPSLVEEVLVEDEFDEFYEDDDDDGAYFEDDLLEDEMPQVGDGGGGGGISLAGNKWDKEALAIAKEVCRSFDGDLGIYAFKTLLNFTIRVRIEKLSNKSSSPNMEDIEAFSSAYRKRLDEAEVAGSIPENISLEVSSPGVERIVRIPEDLERFKERTMYAKYVTQEAAETGSSSELEVVFRLVSFDLETKTCTWVVADVKVNREKSGKGKPLNKKQKEWRLNTTFDSLRLVRFYSEI